MNTNQYISNGAKYRIRSFFSSIDRSIRDTIFPSNLNSETAKNVIPNGKFDTKIKNRKEQQSK